MIDGNFKEFLNGLKGAPERFNALYRLKMTRVAHEAMKSLVSKTPVWTGTAVLNYVATTGRPYAGGVKDGGHPVEPTNQLPLGAEVKRSGAENAAMATLSGLDLKNPYTTIYITNKAPHIDGLEDGALPGPPFKPRSPNGMFGVTLQRLVMLLESGKL